MKQFTIIIKPALNLNNNLMGEWLGIKKEAASKESGTV